VHGTVQAIFHAQQAVHGIVQPIFWQAKVQQFSLFVQMPPFWVEALQFLYSSKNFFTGTLSWNKSLGGLA
jgi:hypothetical protein